MKKQLTCVFLTCMDNSKWIVTLKKIEQESSKRDFIPHTGGLGTLSIYACKIIHRKEHTRCIFLWFTLQFRLHLQRWRVRYYRRLNLWVPCFVYNSNSKNIFFEIHSQRIVLYNFIFLKIIACMLQSIRPACKFLP